MDIFGNCEKCIKSEIAEIALSYPKGCVFTTKNIFNNETIKKFTA